MMDSALRASAMLRGSRTPDISIAIPALNEAENVQPLYRRLRDVLGRLTDQFEIVFVSDGSTDETPQRVKDIRARDPRVKLLHLSRPFGHQNAILAGLDHASGRVVVTMDADLQHPPEVLPDLLAAWEAGAEVVHAVRRPVRRGNPLIQACKRIGYALLERLCDVDIVPQSADFRLYDRRAVQAMRSLREHGRFNRGLARWIGFRQAVVSFDEGRRHGGMPKYSFFKLLRLLTDGMFSLSAKPLHYVGIVGLVFSVLSGMYLAFVLIGHVFDLAGFRDVTGWASLIAVVLCMGGIQLTGLWLMGQYLGRTYEEVKRRPSYIVAEALGLRSDAMEPYDRSPRREPRLVERGSTAPEWRSTTRFAEMELPHRDRT